MNNEKSPSNFVFLHASYISNFFIRHADYLLIAGTGLLLFLNAMVLFMNFTELSNQIFEGSNSIENGYVSTIIESIIGRNLVVLDFVYLGMYQLSAILSCKFKLSYVLFLVYLQLAKIFLSSNLPDALISANIGIQIILTFQIFFIVLNLYSKDLHHQNHINESLTIITPQNFI